MTQTPAPHENAPAPPAELLHLIDARPTEDPYAPASIAAEGFVHCSADEAQALAVAERFFGHAERLLLLVIDVSALDAEVRMEPGADLPDEWFPHVFGPIPQRAIVGERVVVRTDAGWRIDDASA